MTHITSALDNLTVEGELYESLPDGALRCYACAHRCLIKEGRRGICQVRFNRGGKLYVPHGYVAALQADPIEKKPFNHVYPGEEALTFGMLGCDFHCGFCFPGDTKVATNRGLVAFADLFSSAAYTRQEADAEIAFPTGLQAVTSTGELRPVRGVFKHPYQGQLAVIQPHYLPAIKCTPDHRVYATDDVSSAPKPVQARHLTPNHSLAIPRCPVIPVPWINAMDEFRGAEAAQPAGWNLSTDERNSAWDAGQSGLTSNPVGLRAAAVEWYEASQAEPKLVETDQYFLVPIKELSVEEFSGPVYNMEVEELHNYLAGFFLVSNCQNWVTSQVGRDSESDSSVNYIHRIQPEQMVQLAQRSGASVVASSYNEPLITSEWAVDIFKQAIAAGLKCVFISNGNATPEALQYLRPYLSAYKIDLKTMQDKHYRQLGGVLQHVLDSIRMAHDLGLWVEVVTLIIPGFNDSTEELMDAARYISSVSHDIPWHVTAFHPDYKMTDPAPTSVATLIKAAEIGQEAGLDFVYAGNLPGRVNEYENTFCPQCQTTLVERSGYTIYGYHITAQGTCPKCGTQVPGVWTDQPESVKIGGWGLPRRVRG